LADADLPLLLVLVGPTAVGKSDLALAWAEEVGAEIIAADSTTVYRGVDVGTAKPTRADQQRVPHHLLDVADPTEQFTAARFQTLARAAIHEIGERGRLPLVVGGTGLFVRALVANYPFAPPAPAIRTRLGAWQTREGLDALRRQLRLVDPASYHAIDARDARRILRALEVYWATGRPLPRTAPPSPYRLLMVGLERSREQLAVRIAARARSQLAQGLQPELLALHRRGVPWSAPALQALGYRETALWARGRLSAAQLLPLIVLHTRQYAKRQLTWFRREPDIRWISLDSTSPAQALALVRMWTRAMRQG